MIKDIYPKIQQAVSVDADVRSVLAGPTTGAELRFYPFGQAPEKQVSSGLAYAVWQTVSGSPYNTLGAHLGRPTHDDWTVQIDVYGSDQAKVRQAGSAILAALEKSGWYIESHRGESQEAQTKRWRYSFDASTVQIR